jgi:hypothetical protein
MPGFLVCERAHTITSISGGQESLRLKFSAELKLNYLTGQTRKIDGENVQPTGVTQLLTEALICDY